MFKIIEGDCIKYPDLNSIRKNLSTLIWDVTASCNLNCIHCYNTSKYPKSGLESELSTREAKNAIKKINRFGFNHIHMLGGEPLYRKDIYDLMRSARDLELEVTVNTNGTLLNKEKIESLIDMDISQIVFSLDGSTNEVNDKIRGEGTFDKCLKNLKELKKTIESQNSDMEIGIAYTLTKPNLHQTGDILKLASSLGVDNLDVMELYESGEALDNENLKYTYKEGIKSYERLAKTYWENEHLMGDITVQIDTYISLAEYLKSKYTPNVLVHPKNMGCVAGTERWTMEADGRLNPCGICDTEYYNKEPIADGHLNIQDINIKNVETLEDVFLSEYFQSFLNFRDSNFFSDSEPCKHCNHSECKPCPFLHYKDDVIDECKTTEVTKQNFLKSYEDSVPFLKGPYKQEKDRVYQIYDNRFEEYRKITGSGNLILDLIKSNKGLTVSDLVNKISTKVEEEIPEEEIKEDTTFFLHKLKLLGQISFKKDYI